MIKKFSVIYPQNRWFVLGEGSRYTTSKEVFWRGEETRLSEEDEQAKMGGALIKDETRKEDKEDEGHAKKIEDTDKRMKQIRHKGGFWQVSLILLANWV